MNMPPIGLLRPPRVGTHRLVALSPASVYITPSREDLRPEMLPTSNQGNTPQCAAYAMAGWLEWFKWKYYGVYQQIDPAPIYKRAKQIDGAPKEDGTYLESVLQAAQDLSLLAPVDRDSIREVVEPGQVRQAIHRYGPILCAFNITTGWAEAQANGWIPDKGVPYGGHAVVGIGYADNEQQPWFGLQNSWGDKQGWMGFNRMTPQQFANQFQYGLVWTS